MRNSNFFFFAPGKKQNKKSVARIFLESIIDARKISSQATVDGTMFVQHGDTRFAPLALYS